MGAFEEPFDGFLIRGKFINRSVSSEWKFRLNSGGTILDVSDIVDPTTKEFEWRRETKPNDISIIFYYCSAIQRIEEFSGVGLCDNLNLSFCGCSEMTYLDLSNSDFRNIKTMNRFCENCIKLETIVFKNWDMGKITSASGAFGLCSSLTSIKGKIQNLKVSISFASCPLTNESAMVFINGLAEVETPQKITFSAATYATLTPEQIALAESKNWNIVSV